ncbi:NACHT domain-containing protein [Actinoplanes sp. HUAS TT8]|uniref:NACHT domain-containing protein n=1 Tax=Actinoplanes sp. HUAS TT8 TaxID=3447453 RepID=UPI003F5206FC
MAAWLSSFLDNGDKVSSIVGGIAAVIGLWLTVRAGLRRRQRATPQVLHPLLTAQRADAARHRYRFFGEHVPALTDLYVRTRAAPGGPQPEKGRTIPAVQVLTAHRHAVLLGDAGAGKSTFLATVTGDLARRALTRRAGGEIAVLLHASDLVEHAVPEAIVRAARREHGIDLPTEIFERAPRSGQAWRVLVDGLDEVVAAPDRDKVLWRIRDLIGGDGPYRFLLTCRPLTRSELNSLHGPDVGLYDLRPFDRAELDEFARRWFAARYPHDRRRADATAGRFLARIAGARLGPVARIPLLATIAALVYEFQDGRALPSSRAALYDRFVDHLLDGQRSLDRFREAIEPELLARGTAGKAVAEWLFADIRRHVGALLETCGEAWLADPETDLADVAATRLRDLIAVTPDGVRVLRDLLIATGICTLRQERVVFAHLSFAEYFAARAGDPAFDRAAWLARAANPAERSVVAFAAARRPESDDLITALLDGGAIVAAGDLLADGVPARPETAARTINLLVDQVVDETGQAPEALRILGELSVETWVFQRLVDLAGRPDVPGWTRALIADRLADVDPARGNELLHRVSKQADDVLRSWIADAVEDHGGKVDPHLRVPLSRDATGPPPGALGRHALALRLTDARVTGSQRMAAAQELARAGDLEPLRAMAAAPGVDPLDQVTIATWLADAGDPDLLRVLGRYRNVSVPAQYAAAVALFDRGDQYAEAALSKIAMKHFDRPMAFGAAARSAVLGDREPLRWLVRSGDQPQIRLAAARRLAALGEVDPLTWMLADRLEPRDEVAVRVELLRSGRAGHLPGLAELVRRHPLRLHRTIELWYVMAAYGDGPALRRLRRLADHRPGSLTSIWTAVVLADLDDAHGRDLLSRVAGRRFARTRTRMRATASLLTIAPRQGREVLAGLATRPGRPRLRLEASSAAVRRLGDWTLLEDLAFDDQVPISVRREALATLTRPVPGDVLETPLMRSLDLRARVAALARDPATPTALRLPASAALPFDEARSLLTALAAPGNRTSDRAYALLVLATIDARAATEGWSRLLRDPRIPRLSRWFLTFREFEQLAEADMDAVVDRIGGDLDDLGVWRWVLGGIRLVLRRPEQVLGDLPED